MKLELDFTPLTNLFKKIDAQSVVVGILDNTTKAASADYSRPVTAFGTLSGSTKRRFVKRAGRSKNISLQKLMFILDAKKGLISSVLVNPNNKELSAMAELFAVPVKTQKDINRLQNIARALVRNPILRKDYNPNKPSTAKRKEFNHYGFNTGTLFKNIKARYFAQ